MNRRYRADVALLLVGSTATSLWLLDWAFGLVAAHAAELAAVLEAVR